MSDLEKLGNDQLKNGPEGLGYCLAMIMVGWATIIVDQI